ncbi:hypothetical protein Lesp01_50920 [Lentzea sp. NBRC 102530]|nr:hypothetical protein Lesp01_50920 [Lentzea sp. NBRC 102530]
MNLEADMSERSPAKQPRRRITNRLRLSPARAQQSQDDVADALLTDAGIDSEHSAVPKSDNAEPILLTPERSASHGGRRRPRESLDRCDDPQYRLAAA